jgi:hypothetical protein
MVHNITGTLNKSGVVDESLLQRDDVGDNVTISMEPQQVSRHVIFPFHMQAVCVIRHL